MIFSSKRNKVEPRRSNMEACVSILGFVLALGVICGLGALIYGLVRGSLSGTIGGSIVFGVSGIFTFVFIIYMIKCVKMDAVRNNANERPSRTNESTGKANHQIEREQISSNQVTTISETSKRNHNQNQGQCQTNKGKELPFTVHKDRSADGSNRAYTKQISKSSTQSLQLNHLNQKN